MERLFDTTPVRTPARRGNSSYPIMRRKGQPPAEHESGDAALLATTILMISGRLRSRMRSVARRAGVDPGVMALLLLFGESNGTLLVRDIAEYLGVGSTTASRIATRADAAGLVDKMAGFIDQREVQCRLSGRGRAVVVDCLDALRPEADNVLGRLNSAQIADARTRLSPGLSLDRDRNWGWRVGVRAGMPAGE